MILRHGHAEVVEAVQTAVVQGFSFGAPTEGEVELAELIVDAIPSTEMVRLVNSGTEATMSAASRMGGHGTREDPQVRWRPRRCAA